jgi:hypothetical protein
MRRDVDLLRDLMLALEPIERSPPEPVFLELDEMARTLGRSSETIGEHLNHLLVQGFIDGPGVYFDDWLFRKLTPKGHALADNIRDARHWSDIKRTYSFAIEQ